MSSDKASLRARIRAQRAARTPSAHEAEWFAAEVLAISHGPLAAYVSMTREPDTSSLLAQVPDVLLPRTTRLDDGSVSLEWVRYDTSTEMEKSPLGMSEPVGAAVGTGGDILQTCDAVVIPSLAVDTSGRRLGQGGGYYDRVLEPLLAHTKRPIIVTLLFDDELLDDVHAEPHDCSVDIAITPTRTVRFAD